MQTIFSTTTLDFELVKASLEPFKSSNPDLTRALCSSDAGVLEVAQQQLRMVLDKRFMRGNTSAFATFIALVSDLTNKSSWEELRVQYSEKQTIDLDEPRECACGKSDCIYMGIFHGETGNLLLGSTCIAKMGITNPKELAKQKRLLKMRGVCKGCKIKIDPHYELCFKCKFPNSCNVCGKACAKKYTKCYTCH